MASVIRSFDNSKFTEHTTDKLAELQGIHDFIVDKNEQDIGILNGDIQITTSVVKVKEKEPKKAQYRLDQ